MKVEHFLPDGNTVNKKLVIKRYLQSNWFCYLTEPIQNLKFNKDMLEYHFSSHLKSN